MSIIKGALVVNGQTTSYNLTYSQYDYWSSNGADQQRTSGAFYRTEKQVIQNNSVILQNNNFMWIWFWDINDNPIGYKISNNGSTYAPTAVGDFSLGNITSLDISIPSNAYTFGLVNYNQSYSDADGVIVAVSDNDFLTNTISYEPPSTAIDNIYYGGAIVENHLSFDGTDDYVEFGILPLSNNDFVIEIESIGDINFDTGSAGGSSKYFRISYAENDLFIRFDDGSTNYQIDANPTLDVSQFATYRLEKIGGTFSFYQNNNLIASESVPTSSTFTSNFPTWIQKQDFDRDGGVIVFYNGSLSYLSIEIDNSPYLEYLFNEGSGTTLTDSVGTNDATIFGATWESETLYNTIDRVYAGGALVYGQAPVYTYELIADVEVTANTTQIDFDNLNITKDDELRLVYTSIGTSTSTSIGLFVNDNTTLSNYYFQRLIGDGSSLSAGRFNLNQIYITRPYGSGYADIKISNNDRYVVQSYNKEYTNTSKSDIAQWNWNLVGDFTVSSINKLSLITLDTSRLITPNSRFQLYKVNKGVA